MRGIFIGLTLALIALPAWAQTRDENAARCVGTDPDTRISACTALLQSGQEAANNIPLIYVDRGNGYSNKGLYDQAITDYSQAISLNPNYASAFYNRGNAYRNKGLYDQAIADYTKAIALTPDYPNAYGNRGLAYEKKGQRDQAISDYRKALQLRPGDRVGQEGLKSFGITP